jgi:multisubunit Na+/H+ antiporter MnhB subunit
MNFVERWLSISPDGGSGSFEAGAILAVVIVICALVFRGRLQHAWCTLIGNVAWPK